MSWLGKVKSRLTASKGRGQILMIYGVGAMAVMGFAGLAVDGGYIFSERRLAQNAADAAALVGGRDIVNGHFTSIDSDVTTYVHGNAGSTASPSWSYVDNSGATVSQSSATGVSVLVSKTFNTFFLQALGQSTFTVSARGTARVQMLGSVSEAPFIVCTNALQYTNSNNPPPYSTGILNTSTSPPTVNSAAVGMDFLIHASQVQSDGDCGWNGGSGSFKGNAAGGGCSAVPCYYPFTTGNTSGQIDVRVAGMQGCSGAYADFVDGCVALLPITPQKTSSANTCGGTAPSNNMCVVTWAAFQIYRGNHPPGPPGCNTNNCHHGVLLGNVLVTQGAGVNWTPGGNGTLVVRLLG